MKNKGTLNDKSADNLLSLLTRLRGADSIEQSITPIDLHISSAIMTMQERASDMSTKVHKDEVMSKEFRKHFSSLLPAVARRQ